MFDSKPYWLHMAEWVDRATTDDDYQERLMQAVFLLGKEEWWEFSSYLIRGHRE